MLIFYPKNFEQYLQYLATTKQTSTPPLRHISKNFNRNCCSESFIFKLIKIQYEITFDRVKLFFASTHSVKTINQIDELRKI